MRGGPRGGTDPGAGDRWRGARDRRAGRACLVPPLPGDAPVPRRAWAAAAPPIPRDSGDTQDPVSTATRGSPRVGPIAASAEATGVPLPWAGGGGAGERTVSRTGGLG